MLDQGHRFFIQEKKRKELADLWLKVISGRYKPEELKQPLF